MKDKNNGRGIFYGVIGVATLVVAIIGATFAFFTASATNDNVIKGDTATVQLGLSVNKVTTADETKGGMIPLANSMVQRAVYGTDSVKKETATGADADICVDDNGNAVCQIYEIVLTNNSTAGVFVDGYVALKGGSGQPTDYTTYSQTKNNKFASDNLSTALAGNSTEGKNTTMRWAQLIKTGNSYSTAGDFQLGLTTTEKVTFTDIGVATDTNGALATNVANIRDQYTESTDEEDNKGIYGSLNINNTGTANAYRVINKNYIRVSDHNWNDGVNETYTQNDDVTSALVYNHYLSDTGDSKSRTYYIVVWLTENGANQTAGQEGNPSANDFFNGNVKFISSQGNEVSASFQSYARVHSNNSVTTTP